MCGSGSVISWRGGVRVVSHLTGLSRNTIAKGIEELRSAKPLPVEPIRQPGVGRPSIVVNNPKLDSDLRFIMEETTAGDPMRPLLWTSKSTKNIARGADQTESSRQTTYCMSSVA
ncbi:MAG: hypothetical protein JRN20_01560 [Nitrososphaerota archaeon]|nr:hypothetical protein [Nitrososphaerota archaeon]